MHKLYCLFEKIDNEKERPFFTKKKYFLLNEKGSNKGHHLG